MNIWIFPFAVLLFALFAPQCSQGQSHLPAPAGGKPSFMSTHDVFPLLWEDFDEYPQGPFAQQPFRWAFCNAINEHGAQIHYSGDNGYLVLDYDSGPAPCLMLPLSPGPGHLGLKLWMPKGGGGRVGVLSRPLPGDAAHPALVLHFRPDGLVEAVLGTDTAYLDYALEAWIEVIVRTDPITGSVGASLRFDGNDGFRIAHQATWISGQVVFGALMLDAPVPGSRCFIDGILYGWSGKSPDCGRE